GNAFLVHHRRAATSLWPPGDGRFGLACIDHHAARSRAGRNMMRRTLTRMRACRSDQTRHRLRANRLLSLECSTCTPIRAGLRRKPGSRPMTAPCLRIALETVAERWRGMTGGSRGWGLGGRAGGRTAGGRNRGGGCRRAIRVAGGGRGSGGGVGEVGGVGGGRSGWGGGTYDPRAVRPETGSAMGVRGRTGPFPLPPGGVPFEFTDVPPHRRKSPTWRNPPSDVQRPNAGNLGPLPPKSARSRPRPPRS